MREACLSLAARHTGIARLINPRQTHAITYVDSPLSDAYSDDTDDALPLGAPLVDVPMARDQHLIDVLSPQSFTLLMAQPWAHRQAFEAACAASPWLPCHCVSIDAAVAARARLGGMLTLVRPDGHICGRWRTPSVDTVLAAIARASAATVTEQAETL